MWHKPFLVLAMQPWWRWHWFWDSLAEYNGESWLQGKMETTVQNQRCVLLYYETCVKVHLVDLVGQWTCEWVCNWILSEEINLTMSVTSSQAASGHLRLQNISSIFFGRMLRLEFTNLSMASSILAHLSLSVLWLMLSTLVQKLVESKSSPRQPCWIRWWYFPFYR